MWMFVFCRDIILLQLKFFDNYFLSLLVFRFLLFYHQTINSIHKLLVSQEYFMIFCIFNILEISHCIIFIILSINYFKSRKQSIDTNIIYLYIIIFVFF